MQSATSQKVSRILPNGFQTVNYLVIATDQKRLLSSTFFFNFWCLQIGHETKKVNKNRIEKKLFGIVQQSSHSESFAKHRGWHPEGNSFLNRIADLICINFWTYNRGQITVEKFSKLSKISFSMKSFRVDFLKSSSTTVKVFILDCWLRI